MFNSLDEKSSISYREAYMTREANVYERPLRILQSCDLGMIPTSICCFNSLDDKSSIVYEGSIHDKGNHRIRTNSTNTPVVWPGTATAESMLFFIV